MQRTVELPGADSWRAHPPATGRTPVTCLNRRAAARSSMRACPLRRSPSSARAVSRRKARLSAGSGPFLPAAERASSASMCFTSATASPGHEAAVMAAPGGRAAVPASSPRSSASLSRKRVSSLSASCARAGWAAAVGSSRRADQRAAAAGGSRRRRQQQHCDLYPDHLAGLDLVALEVRQQLLQPPHGARHSKSKAVSLASWGLGRAPWRPARSRCAGSAGGPVGLQTLAASPCSLQA